MLQDRAQKNLIANRLWENTQGQDWDQTLLK